MAPTIRTFTVLPHLPERLQATAKTGLQPVVVLEPRGRRPVPPHRRPTLFETLEHSPVKLLGAIDQDRLEQLLHDDGFLAHMDRVEEALRQLPDGPDLVPGNLRRGRRRPGRPAATATASPISRAEFGIHESVPIYSGGLGVLAGDHLKRASDLGLPLVGVGLMYREGYFRQYLNVDGWQQERYPENDFFNLPLIPETKPDGTPLLVSVPMPGRDVSMRIWRIQVGRVPLYLLDTNIPQNSADDRQITARLYGGDHDMRIRQEMVLGIGGIRALRALGKMPTVCHMNEGHSAFCGLERIRVMMEENKLDFATAREAVHGRHRASPRTRPCPAGNDVFAPQLIEHYFADYLPQLEDRPARVPRPGPAEPARQQRIVLHDRAGHPPGEHHQRRQQAARQGVAQDVEEHLAGTARGRDADHARSPTASTRRPGCRRRCRSSTTAISACSGRNGRPITASGSGSRTFPTPNCGGPTNAAANGWWPSPGSGCKHQLRTPRRSAGRDRPRRRGARSRGADHRLRPPLRHLQARHPDLPQPGPPGRDPQRQGSAGADHLRRQGPSAATTAARS